MTTRMGAKTAVKMVGEKAMYFINGLDFEVHITDVKQSYGEWRFEIEPVTGFGQVWVSSQSIRPR